MNRSNVHLLDLPDEILLIILNKLNNIDVLYSLLDINNGRLNILAQQNTFTNILNFTSIDDISLIDRFCIDILPRVRRHVKCFIFHPVFMKRILLATDYPNLTKLKIFHCQREIVLKLFTNESPLRSIFQEQITDLILVNSAEPGLRAALKSCTTSIYADIMTFFKNLKKLSIMELSFESYPPLALCDFPSTTFSSPILTHLYIHVRTLDDCLYLLDGRLTQLTTFFVTLHRVDTSSGIVHNMSKLPNLKCFSLKVFCVFERYDKIASLLRRMSSLEKLTLHISITGRNSVIDGTYVQHDIFDFMTQLDSFAFYICTYVKTVHLSYKISSEDIQQTLTNIGQQHVTSMVNYINDQKVTCSIFSLPYGFDYLKELGNKFPNIVFSYVTFLQVRDNDPFKHEFFIRVARSFPSLKYLRVINGEPSKSHDVRPFSYDNRQLYSTIEYSHLTTLDLSYAHWTYVEQFLDEEKTYMPCLTDLGVMVHALKFVTENFTIEQTRRNCAKVKKLFMFKLLVHLKGCSHYFPSLDKHVFSF